MQTNFRALKSWYNYWKINAKKLTEFLNEQKIHCCEQYGFCKGFSTAHTVINIMDNIESAIDNKQFVCGVLIDLQKAFDTVNHNILLEKIQHYGVRGIAQGSI